MDLVVQVHLLLGFFLLVDLAMSCVFSLARAEPLMRDKHRARDFSTLEVVEALFCYPTPII